MGAVTKCNPVDPAAAVGYGRPPMPLAHVAGLPLEEALVAAPAVLAAGAACIALLRARWAARGARPRR